MRVQLLLAACLLGTILANPIPEDTCKSEMKRRNDCLRKYDRDAPEWWEDSFLEKLFTLQDWKDCVGEVTCDHVKKLNDLTVTRYNIVVYLNINLRTCLGNGTFDKFYNICDKPGQSKIPCEDHTGYDCMESEMKKHESCDSEDVEAFDALVPLLVRECQLDRETDRRRKNEDGSTKRWIYKDESTKDESSRSVFLSSFLDIIRTVFTWN